MRTITVKSPTYNGPERRLRIRRWKNERRRSIRWEPWKDDRRACKGRRLEDRFYFNGNR